MQQFDDTTTFMDLQVTSDEEVISIKWDLQLKEGNKLVQKSESNPEEVRRNLPKETRSPSGLLGSGHNRFGIGLQDRLTGMAAWV